MIANSKLGTHKNNDKNLNILIKVFFFILDWLFYFYKITTFFLKKMLIKELKLKMKKCHDIINKNILLIQYNLFYLML